MKSQKKKVHQYRKFRAWQMKLTHDFLGYKDLGYFSSFSIAQMSSLLGSDKLHSTSPAVFWNLPMVVGSPKHWGLHCNWGYKLNNGPSQSLFRDSDLVTQWQASTSLPNFFIPGAYNTTETASSLVASPGLLSAKPQMVYKTPKCLQY